MTRPSTPPILSELRTPSSLATQIAALRALKNEIIGHEQKKETWVGLGVVTPLVRILNTQRASSKRKYRDINGPADHTFQPRGRTEEEEARLQALIIVGSLAQGRRSCLDLRRHMAATILIREYSQAVQHTYHR